MNNPLLQDFPLPYEAAPFHIIKPEHFLPAIKELITLSEKEIEVITNQSENPNFTNTIEALSYSGSKLNIVTSIFFNLHSAETNEEIQQLAMEISPLLTVFSSKISQNDKLFQRVKTVYEQTNSLTIEQQTLLNKTYHGFVRNGANLNTEDKKKLEEIDLKLSEKSLQFGENVLAATNHYFKIITDKQDLAGIPETILTQYQEEAKIRNVEGYVITLQYPSYIPAVTYLENRELRKELSLAFGGKAFGSSNWNNEKIVEEIVQLRQQKANILGYKNFADYILDDRMAKTPKKVEEFLDELLSKAKPYAVKEIEALGKLAKQDNIEKIEAYDHAYYAEKLKKVTFNLNNEELKPFFKLEQVQTAIFKLAENLFNINFKKIENIDVYHPDVQTYEVIENEEYKALLYVDYFPREGKRAGAWMTSYRSQYIKNGKNNRPHVSVVCNFSKPTAETPSLLTFQEVTTLFHEFGHAIHGILANTTYPDLSGTSVKWDFVELPSQFLENYCYEPSFLQTFAKHYLTGETLSLEKINAVASSKNFMEGYQTLRQVGFAKLDMAYHKDPKDIENIKDFETKILSESQLYPTTLETAMSTSFSHIFQGGYSAGYYSYKWAEVLDADAFFYFKKNGLMNKSIAKKYKILLEKGGTEEPMKLYKEFRGEEPKIESLLERAFGK